MKTFSVQKTFSPKIELIEVEQMAKDGNDLKEYLDTPRLGPILYSITQSRFDCKNLYLVNYLNWAHVKPKTPEEVLGVKQVPSELDKQLRAFKGLLIPKAGNFSRYRVESYFFYQLEQFVKQGEGYVFIGIEPLQKSAANEKNFEITQPLMLATPKRSKIQPFKVR